MARYLSGSREEQYRISTLENALEFADKWPCIVFMSVVEYCQKRLEEHPPAIQYQFLWRRFDVLKIQCFYGLLAPLRSCAQEMGASFAKKNGKCSHQVIAQCGYFSSGANAVKNQYWKKPVFLDSEQRIAFVSSNFYIKPWIYRYGYSSTECGFP